MVIQLNGGPFDGDCVVVRDVVVPNRVRVRTHVGNVVEYQVVEDEFYFVGYVEGVSSDADQAS